MNRDEVLKRARNDGCDEREQSIYTKSSAVAKAVGISLGLIIAFIELVFLDRVPIATLAVFVVCFAMDAVESWYRFANLKGKFNLFTGITYSVFAIVLAGCLVHFFCKGY